MQCPNVISGSNVVSVPGFFLNRNIIFLNSEVNQESAMEVALQLEYLKTIGQQGKLVINSEGGDVSSGLVLIDLIKKYKTDTYCYGSAFSIAGVIFLCGQNRSMLPHSKLMLHEPVTFIHDKYNSSEKLTKIKTSLEETEKTLISILEEQTQFSKKEILEIFREERFFTAEECLKLGLCTKIGGL